MRQIRPDKTRKCILSKDYGVLESGAILMLSAVDWMSTEKRPSVHKPGAFPDRRLYGSWDLFEMPHAAEATIR